MNNKNERNADSHHHKVIIPPRAALELNEIRCERNHCDVNKASGSEREYPAGILEKVLNVQAHHGSDRPEATNHILKSLIQKCDENSVERNSASVMTNMKDEVMNWKKMAEFLSNPDRTSIAKSPICALA